MCLMKGCSNSISLDDCFMKCLFCIDFQKYQDDDVGLLIYRELKCEFLGDELNAVLEKIRYSIKSGAGC